MSDLEPRSAEFAQEITDLLGEVLVGDLPPVRSTRADLDRFVVQPRATEGGRPDEAPTKPHPVPLLVNGERLADLHLMVHLGMDHAGRYLKVHRSDFAVYSVLDRKPLLRLDYRADMTSAPTSHWQVHAERGAFTHLLTHGQRKDQRRIRRPHDLSSIHLSTGGERFRPCLEDLLQTVIADCGVDANSGWEQALDRGRERWRRRQVGAVVRDAPSEAARVLAELGYEITPPEHDAPTDRSRNLRRW